MNKYIFVSLLFFIVRFSVSQDFIKTTDQLLKCKIIKEDSVNVYYHPYRNSDKKLSIRKNDIIYHSYENPPALNNLDSVSKLGLDTISYVKTDNFKGYKYHGVFLTPKGLEKILLTNKGAAELYSTAKDKSKGVTYLSISAGFLIGYSLGQMINGENPNIKLMVAGLGCTAVAIPLAYRVRQLFKKSISLYNNDVKLKASSSVLDLKLGWSANRLSLTLKF